MCGCWPVSVSYLECSKRTCIAENATVQVDYATVETRCSGWTSRTSVRTVYNRLEGAERRIDFHIDGTDDAHGIVGQNLRHPRDGKRDVYPWTGHFVTNAQAEGAIEGSVKDYVLDDGFATTFAFSRFDTRHRNISHRTSAWAE